MQIVFGAPGKPARAKFHEYVISLQPCVKAQDFARSLTRWAIETGKMFESEKTRDCPIQSISCPRPVADSKHQRVIVNCTAEAAESIRQAFTAESYSMAPAPRKTPPAPTP